MTISTDLRDLAIKLEKDTHNFTSEWTEDFLIIAARIERLENNFHYLGSCMAATAEGLAYRRPTGVGEIVRQAGLMDALGRALAGFPVWRHRTTAAQAIAHTEAAKNALAERSKTKR